METNTRNSLIATAGTGAVGAGVGAIIGNVKANNQFKILGIAKDIKMDEYVRGKVVTAADRLKESGMKNSQVTKALKKVAAKANQDFSKITKMAKNTKIKWIAGTAAVAAAIGFCVSKLANKPKETCLGTKMHTTQG